MEREYVPVPEREDFEMDRNNYERQLKMMNAIARLQKGVFKKITLEQMAVDLVGELSSLLAVSGCAVFMKGKDGIPAVLAQGGFTEGRRAERLLDEPSLVSWILTTGQPVVSSDVQADAGLSSHVPNGWPARSLMGLPLALGEEMKGLLYLESPKTEGFAGEEENFFQMMADLLSLALERSELRSRIEDLTVHDPLTGCLKPARLKGDLQAEIERSRRYRRPLSLVLIALGGSEEDWPPDEQGMEEQLMKELGALLVRFQRNTDSIYCYQEGQFVAMLPETDGNSALKMAQRVRKAVEQGGLVEKTGHPGGNKPVVRTAVASYPWDGNTIDELLESVRASLQQAHPDDGQQIGRKVSEGRVAEK
jgi:diguanylate cyclase (GGDEF)-like protein